MCDQVRTFFNAHTPHLQPLPIMGLRYIWSLDFVGQLNFTTSDNWYVLVMTKHFSKWLDLVPLLDRYSEGVTCAFLNKILSRFGAPVKVLIDQGTKLCGEFQKLCGKALIDHHMISWNHFEINMLVEWMVYKVKYGLHKGHIQDWDLQLPWLSMGCRFNWQASLSSFSPYLLFGHEPKLLASIWWDVLVVIDPNVWVQTCEQWTTLFWCVMPTAMENLAIVQH